MLFAQDNQYFNSFIFIELFLKAESFERKVFI